ncbi:hypothetical protein [Natrinema soli]|uniref:Uncharacterized protein n=1 Tax=Natrinema soli TaxID=1930624 RepID=A0ABD5SS15_9EURY|nr:hypothetical protein [Natrinema soli]
MAYGTDSQGKYSYGVVNEANRRRLQEALGISTPVTVSGPALADLRSEVEDEATDELAAMGREVKEGLSEPIDAVLLATELSELKDEFKRIPELHNLGVPEYGETPYQNLTPAAWRINDHLVETGFFESAEENLPAFTPEHIHTTTRQLLRMDSIPGTLSELGIPGDEQFALVTNIVTAREQLSWWQPTLNYPPVEAEDDYDEGVAYETVAPLHHRAMEGALLWIDGLDWWIWQHEVLVTDEMIDRGVWDVKSMLAGAYLMGDAVRRLAEGTVGDEDLTTLITVSAAIMITGQEFLAEDIAWIDDEMRKPLDEAHKEV